MAKSQSHCTLRTLEFNPTDEKDQKKSAVLCSAPFLSRFIEQIPDGGEQKEQKEQKERKEQKEKKEEKTPPLTLRLINGSFVPGMVISHPNLQELDLTNNAVSVETIGALDKSLASCSHLRKLVLDRVPLSPAIQSWTTLLAGIRGLNYLSCQSQQWTHESWEIFLRYLASQPNLTHLDLRGTSLSSDQTKRLVETLRSSNLQLTECLIDPMPQELSIVLQRNRQKEALEKQWQSLVATIEFHQAKLNEIKESTIRMTEEELKQAEQEVTQATQQLQALERQSYPLPSDRRPRSSDYRSFFVHWIEAWGLIAGRQDIVEKAVDYYQMAIRMQEKYAPQDKAQLKSVYSSYLQTLVQWPKPVDPPTYPVQLALWAAEDAYQKKIPEAAGWVRTCYQHYLEVFTRRIGQASQEKGVLQNVYEALKFLRILKSKSGALAPDPQADYFGQVAQALYRRPHASLALFTEALSIAEQAEREKEPRAKVILESIHEAYIRKISQSTLEAKDSETALRRSQDLLSKVQETKTKKFNHRARSLGLCRETFLRIVERFYQADGQEEAIMDLLEYVPPTGEFKARLDAVILTCSKRYLQKRISDYLVKHCGSFSRTISRFPEELQTFQVSLKTVKSHPEFMKKLNDFLEASQARYSHLYWREVFNDLRAIFYRIAKISILDEAHEKSSSDLYASASPAVRASMPEPSAPLASPSHSSSRQESVDPKEAKETKVAETIPEVVIPKRPKGETVRDHLDYLEQLGVTREQISTEAEKEYGRFMIDFFNEQIMEDPVFLNDGHTYDKEKIMKWIDTKTEAKIIPTSPFNPNVALNRNDIKPNHSMQGFIIEFLERKIAERIQEMKKEAHAKAMKKRSDESSVYLSSSPSSQGMFSFSSSYCASSSSFVSDRLFSGSSASISSSSSSYSGLTSVSSSSLFSSSQGDQGSVSLFSSSSSSSCLYPEPSAPLWTGPS